MRIYYSTDNGVLYHGDCLKVLPEIESGSIDLVFTDPPYGHNLNDGDLFSSFGEGFMEREKNIHRPILNDRDETQSLIKFLISESSRLLSPGSCLCCCCAGGGGKEPKFAIWSMMMDEILGFKQMVVWDKGPMGLGWHYRRSYEVILVSQHKGPGKCNWYDTTKKVENIIRPDTGIRKIRPYLYHHPTQKTDALAAHFINLHTKPGDTVLDPFVGSGSTLVACEKLKRRWIGIELDEQYCEMAAKNLEKETCQMEMF